MRFLRSMIMGGLALFALAAVSVNVSYANEWPAVHEISISLDEPMNFNDFSLVAEHVNLASVDPVYQPVGVRSIGELKPEYLASYQTHGLSVIEVRSRC